MTAKITTGARVKVTAQMGGTFFGRHYNKVGTVERVRDDVIYVRFDHNNELDYGMMHNVEVVQASPDAQGFIQNTTGVLPADRGTIADVMYNDGTIILGIAIGTGAPKRASNNGNSYSATCWDVGRGGANIKAYRIPSVESPRRVTHEQMTKGMTVKLVGEGEGHTHWGFKLGQVYKCVTGGPIAPCGTAAGRNWAGWVWEVVVVEEAPLVTLDDQLAALKAELTSVKAEITEATKEVTAANAKLEVAEAKRVVLIGTLAKHGIQFIGETVKAQTALEAFEAGTLEVGMTLLCVEPQDADEHSVGTEYKVIQRDVGDECEFKLESNDGYGYWIENENLAGYTVVV